MALRIIKKIKLLKKPNLSCLCSKPQENLDFNDETNSNKEEIYETECSKPVLVRKPKIEDHVGIKRHLNNLEQFFKDNPSTLSYRKFIPSKILQTKATKHPHNLYLICPDIASNIAEHVYQRLENKNQIIAESNPGVGLISKALLNKGIPSIRLYEFNLEYHEYIRTLFNEKISLYQKDLFSLYKYGYLDNLDQGKRVATLLEGIPKKCWTGEPAFTAVGTLSQTMYLKYLIKSIVLQKEPATYGRIDHFFITYENVYQAFKATNEYFVHFYKSWNILLQMFFEVNLIEKYPRKFFLPWESRSKKNLTSRAYDQENLYLMKVSMKKEFPINADHFVPFFGFITTLYNRGNTSVISTCEKWIPGSGEHLLLPKLKHDHYFEDLCIFTKFRELTVNQIISIYNELRAMPNYSSSPFMDMIEQELLKTETIETNLNDYHKKEFGVK